MAFLIEVRDLKKYFPVGGGLFRKPAGYIRAVDGVTFNIREGETLGLAGESGCGKTTTAKLIMNLYQPTDGTVLYRGRDIYQLDKDELQSLHREMQMVFQSPTSSLNPRKTVKHILSRPFLKYEKVDTEELESKILKLLETVGLHPAERLIDKYPHEFSGGQKQRIGVARAIALHPKFIVADEPVSSLDMSVRGQILNLLNSLQKDLGLTYLFITHDLAVIRSVAKRIAIMYLGKIVELADVEELYGNALHPYTQSLLSATLIPDPKIARSRKRIVLKGVLPSPISPPKGCKFHTRCPFAMAKCHETEPFLDEIFKGHYVACYLTR